MKNEPAFSKNGLPLSQEVRRLRQDLSGAVAMIFGLAIVPLLLVMGVAVDFSRATSAKSRLQEASDAAVLGCGLAAKCDSGPTAAAGR